MQEDLSHFLLLLVPLHGTATTMVSPTGGMGLLEVPVTLRLMGI